MKKLTLPTRMHCRACEQRVQRAVNALDGIRSVTTDLSRQSVVVEFDETVVLGSDVEATVADQMTHDLGG